MPVELEDNESIQIVSVHCKNNSDWPQIRISF